MRIICFVSLLLWGTLALQDAAPADAAPADAAPADAAPADAAPADAAPADAPAAPARKHHAALIQKCINAEIDSLLAFYRQIDRRPPLGSRPQSSILPS